LLSGVWAGFLLLKPHLLILLLPGLLITRSWRVLLGFIATLVFLLVGSLLLAGVDGMFAWLGVIRSFSEASFHSLPNMMNGRGLAFNLARVFTTWAAWLIAIPLMMMVAVFTLRLWKHRRLPEKFLWLMLATLAGTFIVSWHSDLYLWICLIPFLYSLDIQGEVPTPFLGVWVFGPPVIFLLVYLVRLELAQPALAMAMLGFNLFLLGFSARRLVLTFERWHDG